MTDLILCRGLTFRCEIGFHPVEKSKKQKIVIDLEASVAPIKKELADQIRGIRLDYFRANRQIGELLKRKKFKLIEAAAGAVADLILENFDVRAVTVSLTKYPLGIPNMESVTYRCHRKK
ncbi:MAG: dihydroneopterin aldolase [Deltaproteobacteria bacterium]|nr:dihydroneopterin aldolase [Deltaproteobacteria bacterium]